MFGGIYINAFSIYVLHERFYGFGFWVLHSGACAGLPFVKPLFKVSPDPCSCSINPILILLLFCLETGTPCEEQEISGTSLYQRTFIAKPILEHVELCFQSVTSLLGTTGYVIRSGAPLLRLWEPLYLYVWEYLSVWSESNLPVLSLLKHLYISIPHCTRPYITCMQEKKTAKEENAQVHGKQSCAPPHLVSAGVHCGWGTVNRSIVMKKNGTTSVSKCMASHRRAAHC